MLKEFLQELNIEFTDEMQKRFSDFTDILISENEKIECEEISKLLLKFFYKRMLVK